MKKTVRDYYPDGVLRYEAEFVDEVLDGVVRLWHPNGVPASETPMSMGLRHGVEKHWNVKGVLLGANEFVHGTGVVCIWYPNGQMMTEVTTVDGMRTGRMRVFDDAGELLAETYWIAGKSVSRKRYQSEADENPSLPQYPESERSEASDVVLDSESARSSDASAGDVDKLGEQLLAGRGVRDAREWLTDATAPSRTLGEATDQADSLTLVEELLRRGAVTVYAVEIDGADDEDQNTGKLVVALPSTAKQRKSILAFCGRMAREQGFDPDPDVGQRYLLMMLD